MRNFANLTCKGRASASCSLMDLSAWKDMDPHLLLGLVNTELRNQAESLEDLAKTHDIAEEGLVKHLGEAGYTYQEDLRQFR